METTVILDRVWPERVGAYATNFLGQGLLERAKGKLVSDQKIRATVILTDDDAQKIFGWMQENPGHAYPFSFTANNLIVGIELGSRNLVSV